MYEGTIGEIRIFAGNFAPKDWLFCNGQLLPITQNTALFSVIGTSYGGDGRSNFALPDLRGKAIVGVGKVNSTNVVLGQPLGVAVNNTSKVEAVQGTDGVEVSMNKDNHQPSLGLNYVICINGLYPQRP
jgi:microcystin-dependent protein